MQPLIKRYAKNPILTPKDIPYPVSTVHNAGIVKYKHTYIMLFRSHLNTGRSIIGLATSSDGFQFKAQTKPFLTASSETTAYDAFGVEDPRITPLEDRFLITYSAYSKFGVRIGIAETHDFKSVKKLGYITEPDHRNVVLFPEKINGNYMRLDRPHSHNHKWSMWISSSPDLMHWGNATCILSPKTYHWTEMKVGPGSPPIKTTEGWLNIFHGVFSTMAGGVYRLGVALHNLKDPTQLRGIYNGWILEPQEPYERTGYVPNVVFTCGAITEPDGTLKLYWGAADTVMCVGEAKIETLINLCLTP